MTKNLISYTFLSITLLSSNFIIINQVDAAQRLTVYDVSMVADKKARRVGDVLTVLVLERAPLRLVRARAARR